MTQEEILVGEQLISEYMRSQVTLNGVTVSIALAPPYDETRYSKSWDWLIPVLYKVAGEKSLLVLFNPTDILKTFEGCVKKIKMRNEALKQLNENSTN